MFILPIFLGFHFLVLIDSQEPIVLKAKAIELFVLKPINLVALLIIDQFGPKPSNFAEHLLLYF